MDKPLAADTLLVLVGLFFVVELAAGGYPAVALSRFRPASVFRGKLPDGRTSRPVQGLVVVQFVLSTGLVVGMLVIWQQVEFLRSKDLGFQQEHVVQMDARQVRRQIRLLLQRMSQAAESSSAIQHVTTTWHEIAGVRVAAPRRFRLQDRNSVRLQPARGPEAPFSAHRRSRPRILS